MRRLFLLFRTQCRTVSTHIAKAGSQGPPLPPLKAVTAKREAQTMLKHIYDTQQKFPDAVVMTQVGAFMELYFDQAVEYAPRLNLKVARKNATSPIKGQTFVNMAGFPLQHKEKYERILVNEWGKTVVTLMQDSRHVLQGGTEAEKRPIARVLTPGTLLAESFVDASINNYLCSLQLLSPSQNNGNPGACLMWVDVASGVVKYELVDLPDLGNALTRISPSEILINKSSTSASSSSLIDLPETVATYAPQAALSLHKYPPTEWWNTRANARQRFNIESLGEGPARAFVGLVSYIDECMPGSTLDIQHPERFFSSKTMQLDARAREALELTTTTNSGVRRGAKSAKGSLLSVIRRTQTTSGARLLQEWLMAPLQDPQEIKQRQNKVQFFMNLSRADLVSIQSLLADLPDGTRIIQKLWQPKVDPLDLISFARSVQVFHDLHKILGKIKQVPDDWAAALKSLGVKPVNFAKKIINNINMDALIASGSAVTDSADSNELEDALIEKPSGRASSKKPNGRRKPAANPIVGMAPATNRDYLPVLNPTISAGLKNIYNREAGFAEREEKIMERLREIYGPSVDLRWSPSYQFYVHIITNGANEPDRERLLSRSKKTAYIADAEWSQLGTERLRLSNDLREEEERILNNMRTEVLTDYATVMRMLYSLGDEIDVQMSFAVLALEKRLVQPEVVEDAGVYTVEKGRHITVETGLATGGYASSGFVANDCDLSAPKPVCMITGPNMGGKSTFIRQNAIITILAHIGSFVPARSAKIGIVDRIFCRLGAGDDLYNGRSTFMMEMLETAAILNRTTNRSLAILDEVGRGTSSKDGVAIAYAAIKHLTINKGCRTLFATHYGEEIWDVVSKEDTNGSLVGGIRLLQASLSVEDNDTNHSLNSNGTSNTKQIKFDYRLKPGISTSSCGLLIADIAGFPNSALQDALKVANDF